MTTAAASGPGAAQSPVKRLGSGGTLFDTAFAAAVADAEATLARAAPGLAAGFREALPRAADLIARRLLGALYREDLAGVRTDACWRGNRLRLAVDAEYRPVQRHAFDRVEFAAPVDADPARLLAHLTELAGADPLGVELADAAVKLALAYARQERSAAILREHASRSSAPDSLALAGNLRADDQSVFFERLATEGHNLHPCGRTRLGWDSADALAHDLEAGHTSVGFVAVRRDLHLGDDVGPVLGLPAQPYAIQPVHAWQLDRVIRHRYADLIGAYAVVPLDVTLPAAPTAALRTVLVEPGPDGVRRYLKLSLDVQITSTRRTVSIASTRNGPLISALLHRLLADHPAGARVLLMDEVAGAAVATPAGHTRDLAAIVRSGLDGRLGPGEVAVPGVALAATSPVTGGTVLGELVDRFAATRGLAGRSAAALGFLDGYARLLLPPLLHLATRYGIGFEAHLQNCVPTFVDGVPHRLALRDFAGLRIHRPRLAGRGVRLPLWPGSVVGTDDVDVMRAKLGYTALQAHLGELVVRLVGEYDVDEGAAWSVVRHVLDEVYADLRADPASTCDAAADHAFLTAPTVPHKALVRMRLAGTGDIYVPVRNPLR